MPAVPPAPRLIGLVSLLPPVACALTLWFGPDPWRVAAQAGAIVWVALALAFIGGSWCGIAAGAPAAERRNALGWLWFAAILPVLVAFACLLAWNIGALPPEAVLVMQGGAALISTGVDARLGALAPRWWLAWRVPLGIGTGAAAVAAALA